MQTCQPSAVDNAAGIGMITDPTWDVAAGAYIITDASCVNGGLGCFGDICRFCKYFESDKSSHLLPCSDFADIAVPTTRPVDPNATCSQQASSGDQAVGISMETDVACRSGGLGCIANTVCRLCKVQDTDKSQHLQPCVSALSSPLPPVSISPPVVGDCVHQVSPGDLQAGISALDDVSCAQGGLGCFSNACRFCKAWETPQSVHMLSCAELLNPTSPGLRAAALSVGGVDAGLETLLHNDGVKYSLLGLATIGVIAVIAAVMHRGQLKVAQTKSNAQAQQPLSMVYPRGDGSRSFAKVLALCAVNLCILQGTAQATASAGCDLTVSPGDAGVGIKIVTDAACASGGLGCINDVCRFCKLHDTPQSAHLFSCTDFEPATTALPTAIPATPEPTNTSPGTDEPPTSAPATDAPVDAPVPTTAAPVVCGASSSDQAVGVDAVADPSCKFGGLGCYNDNCRFCKAFSTASSQHLLDCSSFATGTSAPATSVPTTTSPPEPQTPSPEVTCGVSAGDFAAGVYAYADPSCEHGGLGCYNGACRYCKHKETPQSAHLQACPSPQPTVTEEPFVPSPPADMDDPDSPTSAPEPEPETPAPIVVVIETPTSAPEPDTHAPEPETPTSAPEPEPETPAPIVVPETPTSAPEPETPAPGPVVVVIETPTSAPEPEVPSPSGEEPIGSPTDINDGVTGPCPFGASEGDIAAGVQVITDPTCISSGLGCFHDVCRFCKVFDSDKSSHLDPCTKYGYNFDTPAPTTQTPETQAPATHPPVQTAAPAICNMDVSDGDKAVGIRVEADASCSSGGLGCVENTQCRFCKLWDTDQSKHLANCTQTAAPVVPLMAAALSTDAQTDELDELMKDPAFKWAFLSAACAGAVAVVALVAFGAKRAVSRSRTDAVEAVEVAADTKEDECPEADAMDNAVNV
ncbi:hypothetical protein P43SY_006595 [Pythium insidiosum]|uniref:Uncharacterized protein n=1 Tax=Pythium insidiosum TaxID=114742 RepID=A0AAD5Q8E1_PYTIN|nr:hypothetical protein P43SY_006595 [Pythium insidiosum]